MRWFVVIVMVLHGLIHLMGGVNELGIAKIQELSGKTLIALPNSVQTLLGAVWVMAVAMFIIAAIGLGIKQTWWKPLAISAMIVSQALIVIWWPDAKWGTIGNIIVFISLFVL